MCLQQLFEMEDKGREKDKVSEKPHELNMRLSL